MAVKLDEKIDSLLYQINFIRDELSKVEKLKNFEVSERVEKILSYQEKVVTIDVGDSEFKTTEETLLSHYSIFTVLMQGEDRHFFIERSPEMFEHIIDYCRSGFNRDQIPDNILPALLTEIEFYRIFDFASELLHYNTTIKIINIFFNSQDIFDTTRGAIVDLMNPATKNGVTLQGGEEMEVELEKDSKVSRIEIKGVSEDDIVTLFYKDNESKEYRKIDLKSEIKKDCFFYIISEIKTKYIKLTNNRDKLINIAFLKFNPD